MSFELSVILAVKYGFSNWPRGRQRQMKIRNVSSFGRGLQLGRGTEKHKVDKIVEEITVAFIV